MLVLRKELDATATDLYQVRIGSIRGTFYCHWLGQSKAYIMQIKLSWQRTLRGNRMKTIECIVQILRWEEACNAILIRLSLIHIYEPTRLGMNSYAVCC